MATTLGISAFFHDSAAALVRDGKIMAAAQEERFSRKKHDPRFPRLAINYCLGEAFIEPNELDAVVFYDNPVLTIDRLIRTVRQYAPQSRDQWLVATRNTLGVKPFVADIIRRFLNHDVPVLFTQHHASHAASAFYPSPFQEAAILTLDGVGEWACTTISHGKDEQIKLLAEQNYPNSLGLLYSALTYFCGFKVNSGEYKLMGLAPYGEPVYAQKILDHLIDLKPDGSFRLNEQYFGFLSGLTMTNDAFAELFGGPPRVPEMRITRREMDLAASIQAVTETIMLRCAQHAVIITGCRKLALAGGVALNCVANGKLIKSGIVDDLWIQPAAGDAGGALGAALLADYAHFGTKRVYNPSTRDTQAGSYLGPAFSSDEVKGFLDRQAIPYHESDSAETWASTIAQALANGKIVGLMCGRMEYGPRSLGARSILGDPRDPETQTTMNLKIKYRESFRPFAPAVLAEASHEYFDLPGESPYMLLVGNVLEGRQLPRVPLAGKDPDDMLEIVRQPRSDIPAITHVDYSARVQTVHQQDHPQFHAILEQFRKQTGCAVLVNTSFNVRGEPIVCSPQDAYRCFMRTEIDLLVLENILLWKSEQPRCEADESWKEEFELD